MARPREDDLGVCRCCFLKDVCKKTKCDKIRVYLGELILDINKIKI